MFFLLKTRIFIGFFIFFWGYLWNTLPNNRVLGGSDLNQKYNEIYENSIKIEKNFGKISLKTFFGTKNQQKF